MGIKEDVEKMLKGEPAEPDFIKKSSEKTYCIDADYEHCLGRINYLQKYISFLEQRVELLNAQISLLEAKGLMRKH